MADENISKQENIEAYKQGVQSTAPAKGWEFKDGERPKGQSDIEYIGVEAHTKDMAPDPDHPSDVRLPVGDLTLKEIFAKMAGVPEQAIKRDIPGNTADYYREIGQHESGHLQGKGGIMDGGLGEEIHGDRTAYNGDNPEIEEVLRDMRKIAAVINPSHATSPALAGVPGGVSPEVNSMKLFAAARQFQDTVAADLMSRGVIQSVADIKKLQSERPEIVGQSIETLKKSGAFDDMEGSKGQYVRQFADDYLTASKKWLQAPEQTSPAVQSAPKAPAMTAAP